MSGPIPSPTVDTVGMLNPMTTAGDTIRGGIAGAPERVAVGTDGQVQTVVAGAPAWATPAAAGMANPMTTPGDLIVGGTAGAPGRLAVGTAGQVPTSNGTTVAWATPTQRIPLLAGLVSTVLGADTVVGHAYLDPTGLTAITLEAVGQVVSGVTGELDLYDLTAAAVVATLAWTETAATRKTASVAVPGTARLYELRVRKSGGAGADYALFSSISLIGS